MSRSGTRVAGRLLAGLLALVPVVILACNEDDENCAPYDAHNPVPGNVIIKVYETTFNPSDRVVHVGDLVEWQNVFSETRTVTSGTGPNDPLKGELFDATLLPYCPGEAIGGRFQLAITQDLPDTIRYFSSMAPPGFPGLLSGKIVVVH